jgi:ABC-type sugar transport system substrate-binding protein
MHFRRSRVFAALVLIFSVAFVATGCGSDDSGGDSDVLSSEQANADLGKGKTLCANTFVKVGTAVPLLDQLREISGNLGMDYKESVANGDFELALNQIGSCARRKAGAIVTIATDNAGAKGALKEASKAGVPIITQYSGAPVPGVDVAIHGDEVEAADRLASWIDENLGEDLDMVVYTATPLAVVKDRIAAFKAAAEERPGWNILTTEELDLTDPTKSATEKTQAALQRYPDADLIIAPWDDPAAGAVSAIRSTGSSDAKVVTWDGVEATFALMRTKDSPLVALQAQPDVTSSELVQTELVHLLKGEEPTAGYFLCVGPTIDAGSVPKPGQLVETGTCKPEK